MTTLAIFLLIAAIAYGLGSRLVARLAPAGHEYRLEHLVFATGIGLGLIGYAVYAIGSVGLLRPSYVGAMLAVCALIAAKPFYETLRTMHWRSAAAHMKSLTATDIFFLAVCIGIPTISLFGVLAPEIGNDALAYHLYHPKLFIAQQHIGYLPYTRESLWPYLTQMLFTLALLFKNVALAKMFHWGFGILTALAVYACGVRFFSHRVARTAAALFIAAPGILMQSVYAYVDLALAFYAFAAIYAFCIWADDRRMRLLVLCGICTGLALSVKLLGGFVLIILGLLIAYASLRERNAARAIMARLLVFAATAGAISCAWYVRSAIVLHNPVYPFLHTLFGAGWHSDLGQYMGLRHDLIGFVRLPWDLVMNISTFGEEQIGVAFLAFLPALFLLPFKEPPVRRLLASMLLYTVLWFIVDQNARFFFVNFALCYLLIAVGLAVAFARYRLVVVRVLLAGCLIFSIALSVYYNRDAIKLAVGRLTPYEYLVRLERTYPVAEFINKTTPANSIILVIGEPRGFYIDRTIISLDIWQCLHHTDPMLFARELHDRHGAPVYLLYVDTPLKHTALPSVFQPLLATPALYQITRTFGEGSMAEYRLYRLL